jgi:protein-S-isoprenylcysteine O-methyltransferase Ste14
MSFKRVLFGFGATALLVSGFGALLFLVAGRWDLPWFWAYLAVYGLFGLSGFLFLDKGLIRERLRPGGKARDTALVAIAKLLALAHYVVAALDVGRFGWSGEIPGAVRLAGLMLFALGGGATMWAMVVNRFFSTVVRIQEERGHYVISDGPYRIVRHPGYVMIFAMALPSGVVLGSWWSMIPMAGFVLLMVRRTALEDRFLHEHLEGYAEYARRVRYRLVPGVW